MYKLEGVPRFEVEVGAHTSMFKPSSFSFAGFGAGADAESSFDTADTLLFLTGIVRFVVVLIGRGKWSMWDVDVSVMTLRGFDCRSV